MIFQDIEVVEVDGDLGVVVVFMVVIMEEGMDIWGGVVVVVEPRLCVLIVVLDVSKCLLLLAGYVKMISFVLKCYNNCTVDPIPPS